MPDTVNIIFCNCTVALKKIQCVSLKTLVSFFYISELPEFSRIGCPVATISMQQLNVKCMDLRLKEDLTSNNTHLYIRASIDNFHRPTRSFSIKDTYEFVAL